MIMEDEIMKENAIQKINKMGKVGGIIINIAKVFCIIGLLFTMAGTIATLCIPKDFIYFKGSTNGSVVINMEAVGKTLSDEDREKINRGESLNGGSVKFEENGKSITMEEAYAEGNTITFSAGEALNQSVSLHDMAYALITAVVTVAMTLVSLFFAGFLCKAFKECASPFEENVIVKMRHFAYSLIPWVILNSISNSMFSSILNGKMDVQISLDINMLIIVLIILALVYIFQYGAMLQQESDETL